MSLSLIILLTILIIFLICFIYIEPIISKHKIKNNNEYGSARFSTFNEINKNFTKEKISKMKMQYMEWVKTPANHLSDKGLVSRITQNFNKKIKRNPI